MKVVFRFNFIFAFLLILFLFQDAISAFFPAFSYLDEVESLIALAYIIFCFIKKRGITLDKHISKLLEIWILFIAMGLISSFISGYQSVLYIILDILTNSKLLINIIVFSIYVSRKNSEVYEETAWIVASLTSVFLILFILHENIFEPIFPYLSDRYGVKSLKLFFSNQTYLALIGVSLLIIHFCFGEKKRINNIFIIFDCIISISTFRTKALGFVAISLVVIYILYYLKIKNIFFIGSILGIIGVIVGWQYLYHYYFSGNSKSLRFLLFTGGLKLSNEFFPFGAGFGTYCSAASKLNFSEAYNLLGMQSIYLWDSLHDMFWASILGQFGYLGTLVYGFFILEIVLMVATMKVKKNRYFWGGILASAYILIASLGESSFISFYSVQFGVLIGYLYSKCKKMDTKFIEDVKHKIEKNSETAICK